MIDNPQTDLRDLIAAALLARIKRATVSKAQPHDAFTSLLAANEYDLADAALAVLPAVPVPPTTHATWLAEAEQRLTAGCPDHGPNGGWLMTCQCEAIDELRRMADEAQQQPTTVDKAAALGMTDTEYRAHSHRAAMDAIQAAVPGLYASVALRVEDALAEAQQQPDTETPSVTLARVRAACDQLHRASVLADGQPRTDRERGVVQAVTRITSVLAASGPGRVADEEAPRG